MNAQDVDSPFVEGSARAQELSSDVIPTSVENYKMGSTSVKKPKGGCDMIDKFPGDRLKLSAEFNGLRKLQDDYDEDQELENGGTIDRGAVGPVPLEVP